MKIHSGLGALGVSELKKHRITERLDAHPTWTDSGRRRRSKP